MIPRILLIQRKRGIRERRGGDKEIGKDYPVLKIVNVENDGVHIRSTAGNS